MFKLRLKTVATECYHLNLSVALHLELLLFEQNLTNLSNSLIMFSVVSFTCPTAVFMSVWKHLLMIMKPLNSKNEAIIRSDADRILINC